MERPSSQPLKLWLETTVATLLPGVPGEDGESDQTSTLNDPPDAPELLSLAARHLTRTSLRSTGSVPVVKLWARPGRTRQGPSVAPPAVLSYTTAVLAAAGSGALASTPSHPIEMAMAVARTPGRPVRTKRNGSKVLGGAGGNRTPVHQPLSARDTTIPAVVLSQHRRRVDYLVT